MSSDAVFSEDSGTGGVVLAIARHLRPAGQWARSPPTLVLEGQIVFSVELTFKIAGREVALDKLAETLV